MNWGRVFFGGLVVAAGVILLLDNTGALDAGEVFTTWWPIVVIVAGFLALVANPRHWAAPVIVMLVGGALLLWTLDVVDSLDLVIPAALILIGIFVIFGRGRPGAEETSADRISTFNFFSGSELASHSKQFTGGNVAAVFGGAEIDLRDAALDTGSRDRRLCRIRGHRDQRARGLAGPDPRLPHIRWLRQRDHQGSDRTGCPHPQCAGHDPLRGCGDQTLNARLRCRG